MGTVYDELHFPDGTDISVGRPADAVPGLEELTREEPYRERPRALLMRSLYESGRQAEALRSYQEFRRFLIDETGIERVVGEAAPGDSIGEIALQTMITDALEARLLCEAGWMARAMGRDAQRTYLGEIRRDGPFGPSESNAP